MRQGVLIGLIAYLGACVPKTQYDDQKAKTQELQRELRRTQAASEECDIETFLEMQEQARALDTVTQELMARNTELANEVTDLREYEVQAKRAERNCKRKTQELEEEHSAELKRVRETYEDLVEELRQELAELKDELETQSP